MIEVKGNGNIISREVAVSSFIRLHLWGKGLIELHQSDHEKVIIETDENLQEYFSVENSGRTLFVTAEVKFRKPVYTVCTIKVFLRQLDVLYIRNDRADVVCPGVLTLSSPIDVKIQSVGNTTLNINAPSIKVLNQCEGNVTLKGKCNLLEIKNQGQGDFDSKELIAEELVLKNFAQGSVKLFANKTIAISHFGQGTVHYSGDAQLNDVKQYGNGEIRRVN